MKAGEINLLHVINAALNNDLFFGVANHSMTVVAVDALYTKPVQTNFLMLGPGKTTDVLVTADQSIGSYYMVARAYSSGKGVPSDNTTTTAILEYVGVNSTSSSPQMPNLPFFKDTKSITQFNVALRSLASPQHPVSIPQTVKENLLYTVGIGLFNGTRSEASMNNFYFVLPSTVSMLQAHYFGIKGVFTDNFSDNPLVQFDYTAENISTSLWAPVKDTRVKVLKYNTTVKVILQGTNIVAGESHPIHLHGYDFYIVGTGLGNYNPRRDPKQFNLVDPPKRTTVNVPVNGWAAIRFVADNLGERTYYLHLHGFI